MTEAILRFVFTKGWYEVGARLGYVLSQRALEANS